MTQTILDIRNLKAEANGKPILRGINLTLKAGEIHAVMGPNGAGKSTLAKALFGHPFYEITDGSVWFQGQNLLEMDPEARARAGLFMSFQYPVELPGVSNLEFMRASVNAKRIAEGLKELNEEEFLILFLDKQKLLGIKEEMGERNVNEGFSGGEKKRNEILQMALLEPKLAILDETDSGLDIDALRKVADGVNSLMNKDMGLLMITHYQRLLNYIEPDRVHVMIEGKIAESGGPELALKLEDCGYDWLMNEEFIG